MFVWGQRVFHAANKHTHSHISTSFIHADCHQPKQTFLLMDHWWRRVCCRFAINYAFASGQRTVLILSLFLLQSSKLQGVLLLLLSPGQLSGALSSQAHSPCDHKTWWWQRQHHAVGILLCSRPWKPGGERQLMLHLLVQP